MARTLHLLTAAALVGVLPTAACHRQRAGESTTPAAPDLSGLEAPLFLSGGLRASVAGRVEGQPAEVVLDVAQPLTTVSRTCFRRGPPAPTATVRFEDPRRGFREAAQVPIARLDIGGRNLGRVEAALSDEDSCTVVAGGDLLEGRALHFDPGARTVRVTPGRQRDEWVAEARGAPENEEAWVIALGVDPRADWPLLTFRAGQAGRLLIGPAVLSTGSVYSQVFASAATTAGFRAGPAVLRELGVPPGAPLPASMGGDVFGIDLFELAPEVAVRNLAMQAREEWADPATIALIGGDVWGRFRMSVDVRAGVLVLRRPKVLGPAKGRQRCASGAASASEEACFELHQRSVPEGIELSAAVWRDLPNGARVDLEALGPDGQPVAPRCRVGLTFSPTDRGVSTAHRLPWGPLAEVLPECERELRKAVSVRFSLWEEEPVPHCAGTCAFVLDLSGERISCECQGSVAEQVSEAERKLLEKYREQLRRR